MWRAGLQPAVVKLGGNKSVAIGDSKGLLESLASIVFDKTIMVQPRKIREENNSLRLTWFFRNDTRWVFIIFFNILFLKRPILGKKMLNYLYKENPDRESKIEDKYYSYLRIQNHPLIWYQTTGSSSGSPAIKRLASPEDGKTGLLFVSKG